MLSYHVVNEEGDVLASCRTPDFALSVARALESESSENLRVVHSEDVKGFQRALRQTVYEIVLGDPYSGEVIDSSRSLRRAKASAEEAAEQWSEPVYVVDTTTDKVVFEL